MNGNIFHYKVDKNWKISRLSFQILHQAGTYLCDKRISIFSFLKIKVQQDPNIGKYALNKVTLRYRHTSNLKKKKKKIYKYQSPREGNGNPFQYSCLKIPWTEEPGRL